MNYFTCERLLRLQDRSDEQRYLDALADWERALQEYKDKLTRLHDEFPRSVQDLTKAVCLHDARVLDMWWGGRGRFNITLRPESDSERLVVLTYALQEPPAIADVLPESIRSEPVAWLYDEFDVEQGKELGEPALFHRILLSDGREIGLRFRALTLNRPVSLVPHPVANGRNRHRDSA